MWIDMQDMCAQCHTCGQDHSRIASDAKLAVARVLRKTPVASVHALVVFLHGRKKLQEIITMKQAVPVSCSCSSKRTETRDWREALRVQAVHGRPYRIDESIGCSAVRTFSVPTPQSSSRWNTLAFHRYQLAARCSHGSSCACCPLRANDTIATVTAVMVSSNGSVAYSAMTAGSLAFRAGTSAQLMTNINVGSNNENAKGAAI